MKHAAFLFFLTLSLTCPLLAETVTFENNWGPPGLTVVSQSPEGLVLNFSMKQVSFHTVLVNGEPMTTIAMPGAMLGNNEDAPNLPGIGKFFALPQGATFSFEIQDQRIMRIQGLDIAPAMRIPADDDDAMPVYRKDPLIYGSHAFYPAQPVVLAEPRLVRGVDASIVGVTPFQYNPVTRELLVYSDIKMKVDFKGGNGHFGEDRLRSRHFDPILKQHFINAAQLPVMDYSRIHAGARGDEAEYVIIIPNELDFRTWARKIQAFRTQQGIKTEIYSLGQVGFSANEIKSWIHNAVKNWSMPPVAVLLLGDDPGSGDDPGIPVPMYSSTPSDNIYADVYGNDDLPDIIITRICARNNAELEEMVMKVIPYETDPPTNPDFYYAPMIAGGWQSDRWFIICCEIVLGYYDKVMGRRPDREYSGASGPPSYWSTNQNTYMLVDYFGPDGLGYIPKTPYHLTDWTGDAEGINAAFNSGAFFGLHRDHGMYSGWSDPHYVIDDLKDLHNDPDLPVVFSFNCSSGAFAGGPECFAEAMTRMHHGAVSVVAASATSYSFVNDTLVFGMMDSMFPDFDPGYGGSVGDNVLEPGHALMSGKFFLEASNWPYNASSKPITYHLFHDHGEAFFCMCSEVPRPLTVSHDSTLALGAPSFTVNADADAHIALTVQVSDIKTEIIGTGTGTGGPASIPITPQYEARLLTVTVTKPNHYRYSGTVYIPEAGSLAQYGNGLAGSGGFVPDLNGSGVPIYGGDITLDLSQGLGAANGMLYIGLGQANLPILGGELLVFPIAASMPIALGGAPGTPGAGSFSIPTTAYVAGITLYLQAFLADNGATKGVSMSNGLEIDFP